MTGPVEDYLRQLRAGLRTGPEETSRILAEAEDHLRESVTAGLAAGLTEAEAAEAAISSFGTVRAVARAHQTPRGQAAAALGGLVLAIWLLAGILLAWCLPVGLVMVVLIAATRPPIWGPGRDPSPSQPAWLLVACGLLGLAMLWSYPRVRRFLQRSAAVTVEDDRR
jgi:HAAS